MPKMTILVIEDVPSIVEAVSMAIEMRWPDAEIISTAKGEHGIDMVTSQSPDIVILDLGLPDISGFDVLKRIRQFSDIPILILTVRSDEADIVKGLECGADDYMVKPFKQMELLARLNGIMRRKRTRGQTSLTCGQLRFEPSSLQLTSGKKEIKISRTEGIILEQLMRNSGKVVSYADLAEAMWGADFPEASESIKVHIHNLRVKLEVDPGEPQIILNKPGMGYYLVNPS